MCSKKGRAQEGVCLRSTEYYDDVICPAYQPLHYSAINREGYREYKSRSYLCKNCPTRDMCTQNAKCEKIATQHICQDCVEMA